MARRPPAAPPPLALPVVLRPPVVPKGTPGDTILATVTAPPAGSLEPINTDKSHALTSLMHRNPQVLEGALYGAVGLLQRRIPARDVVTKAAQPLVEFVLDGRPVFKPASPVDQAGAASTDMLRKLFGAPTEDGSAMREAWIA